VAVAEMEARASHEVAHRRHDPADGCGRARERPWRRDARPLVDDLVADRRAMDDRLARRETVAQNNASG
jgi:hypothetical protein